jgi:hypothetical protein
VGGYINITFTKFKHYMHLMSFIDFFFHFLVEGMIIYIYILPHVYLCLSFKHMDERVLKKYHPSVIVTIDRILLDNIKNYVPRKGNDRYVTTINGFKYKRYFMFIQIILQ